VEARAFLCLVIDKLFGAKELTASDKKK